MAVRDVEWGEPLLEPMRDPELEARAAEGGRVSPGTALFVPVPWAYLGTARLNQRISRRVALDHDLGDLIGLVVSRDNSCRYCFAVQRALLRAVGVEEERIAQLEETLLVAELDARERAALDFARRFSRSNPLLGPQDVRKLESAGFDDDEILDIVSACALSVYFNRISTIPALPPYGWEKLPDRWYARLARPFVALYVKRSVRGRPRPQRLSDEQRSGPFSPMTSALDGHPVAGELREMLDAMWESPHLTRRAKALCFAVVARALGCETSEREAASLAHEEGLSEETCREILGNLSSPELDQVECSAIAFARQTVWYQVPDLQRRARELRAVLALEPFIEAVAVTSLANVICRLGFLARP